MVNFATIKDICTKKISINGHLIPLYLLVIIALFIIYAIYPQRNEVTELPQQTEQIQDEVYNANGVRVYNFRKCNQAVCGVIENYGDRNFDNITLLVTFHDASGKIIYEGGVDAPEFKSLSRIKIEIPAKEDFAYVKFKDIQFNQPLHK